LGSRLIKNFCKKSGAIFNKYLLIFYSKITFFQKVYKDVNTSFLQGVNAVRIGNFTIPDNPNRLPRLLSIAKKIYDTYKGDVIPNYRKNDALAQLLGYKSANNGSYLGVIAALKAYGLIEGRGDIKVSEIAKKATYGNEDEKGNALFTAFLNIPLWKALYDRYRLELPTQDFWAKLQHITGCEAPEAKSMETFITEAFYTDANLIKSVKITTHTGEGLMPKEKLPTETVPSGEFIEVTAGRFYQRLPLTIESVEVVEAMLKVLKNQLKQQKEESKGEVKVT
jgi:hypothetical protein